MRALSGAVGRDRRLTSGARGPLHHFAQVEWDEYVEQVFGIVRVMVEGSTMRLEFVRTEDGVVSDSIVLPSQF